MKTSCLRLKLVELTSLQVSILMIRVKLTLQMLQTLLHTNPSHQDEPFQSIIFYCTHVIKWCYIVVIKVYSK